MSSYDTGERVEKRSERIGNWQVTIHCQLTWNRGSKWTWIVDKTWVGGGDRVYRPGNARLFFDDLGRKPDALIEFERMRVEAIVDTACDALDVTP